MNYSREFIELYNNLFAEINYPKELALEVEKAQYLWEGFCKLPYEVKRQFRMSGDDWNYGYVTKGSYENEDQKEYYHYPVNHLELIQKHDLVDVMNENKAALDFFDYCEKLFRLAADFGVEHAHKLAENNEHIADLPEQMRRGFDENLGLIRFLHYTPSVDAKMLADPHFDRGAMTFHLYESQEGLQFMNWDQTWMDSPVVEGKTVLFTGYGLEQMSGEVLQRTWHRVIPDPHAASPERYSIVLFCDFPDVPGWDRFKNGVARLQPQEYAAKKELS